MQEILPAVESLGPLKILYIFLLGFSLSAAAGFRAFLPLTALSLLVRFGVVSVPQSSSFSWVGSDLALGIFITAMVLEIAADKIPAVDHVQDTGMTFIKPVAGFLLTTVPLAQVDPMLATIAGIVAGASVAEGLHLFKGGTRVASSATSAGLGNPLLSVIEDAVAFVLTGLAWLWAPLAALLVFGVIFWVYRRFSGSEESGGPDGGEPGESDAPEPGARPAPE